MDLRVKTTNYEMNDDITEYIEDRMMIVRKHLGAHDDIVRCEVEVGRHAGHSKNGENWFAEIQLIRPGEPIVRAVSEAQTVHAAVDAVKDELLAILRKSKTKNSLRLRRLGAQMKEWMRFGD